MTNKVIISCSELYTKQQ